jgi:hypothetical protein
MPDWRAGSFNNLGRENKSILFPEEFDYIPVPHFGTETAKAQQA